MPSGIYKRIKKWRWSSESKKKLSLAKKGKKCSEEHKKKVSQNNGRYWLGKMHSEETKNKISKFFKGKPWSEARKKAQKPKKPFMKNGKEYDPHWKEIRKEVYARDNWHCRECGIKTTLLGKSKICCHHIDYDTLNNDPKNLITLCYSCHARTNFNRVDWIKYYKNKIKKITN